MRFCQFANEVSNQRVLGAVQPVDVNTGSRITDSVRLHADNVQWIRNRAGVYVILNAPNFAAYTQTFEIPPNEPPIGSQPIEVRIQPSGYYLPRTVILNLPRDPNPSDSDQPNSLFRVQTIALYPSTTNQTLPGEGLLRVRVTNTDDDPIPAVLLTVATQEDPNTIIARGMTDWRGRIQGEALLRIGGLPTTAFLSLDEFGERGNADNNNNTVNNRNNPDDDTTGVLNRNIPIVVTATFDPNFDPENDLPNPDAMESAPGLQSESIQINAASGEDKKLLIQVTQ